ncbi:ATP-binding protein [Streptomyces sp. NEAU-H3]|uniref:ATP-binding protein n=1 Tax=Streptomyces sp. NEAU-H3 TaxID=2720636 RepID=UPI0014386F1D|nr:ATP-binding protein [Streptomyces sp. NEAU-H3]NJA56724.1 ATP-binding protein [Streptomyces sp. NEAU-H3]
MAYAPEAPASTTAEGPTKHTRFQFTPATKEQSKARVALDGPSGSGKTYTALTIASALGSHIAVIDTERGSARKYANEFSFDVLELSFFSPDDLVEALAAASAAGYDVVIVDSMSHFWSGSGGMLEQVDQASKRGFSGNSFGGWKEARPMERRMVDALVAYPGHVVVTMRSKTDYVLETNDRGKQVPRKVGLKPEQREGLEYEFDIVGSMDYENTLVVTKSRARSLTGAVVREPGIEFGHQIKAWLEDGTKVEPVEDLISAALDPAATFEQLGALMGKVRARRLEGAPMLGADGAPATLGAYIQERGKELRRASQTGNDTERGAA